MDMTNDKALNLIDEKIKQIHQLINNATYENRKVGRDPCDPAN